MSRLRPNRNRRMCGPIEGLWRWEGRASHCDRWAQQRRPWRLRALSTSTRRLLRSQRARNGRGLTLHAGLVERRFQFGG